MKETKKYNRKTLPYIFTLFDINDKDSIASFIMDNKESIENDYKKIKSVKLKGKVKEKIFTVDLSICSKCIKIKEVYKFSKHKRHKNGINTQCRICKNNYKRKIRRYKRKTNPAYVEKEKLRNIINRRKAVKQYIKEDIADIQSRIESGELVLNKSKPDKTFYYGCIYVYTDLRYKGKYYVGKTIQGLQIRDYTHLYGNSNTVFDKEYRQRPNDFELKIIDWAKDEIELDNLERWYIHKVYDSYENGWNTKII